MGKGPGTILKDCIALAIDRNGKKDDKALLEINKTTGGYCLYEEEVKRLFLLQDYGVKSTDKYLKQWYDLSVASRIRDKNGYFFILFYPSDLKGAL